VTFVHNPKMPNKRIQQLADEFLQLVVPEAGVGYPYDVDEVVTYLDKPSQTLAIKRIWETVDMDARPLIECFLKNEPTNKPGRIISSFHDIRFLVHFSKYTLKFRNEVLHAEHNRHWFMPGRTPEQITEAVLDFVAGCSGVAEGDFSNLDGSVSAWMQRCLMNAAYHRYFTNLTELSRYTAMMVSCPARAKKFSMQYEAGVGVKSGSPTTCDLNTLVAAFVMFCAIVFTFPDLALAECFQMIGLAFGDDTLMDERIKTQASRVAVQLGLTLKVEVCKPDTGVTFLARVYPDPLVTNTTFQDPLRTLRKLHLTMRDPNVPLADAALDRLEGYLVTDSLSPIVGDYSRAIRAFYYDKATTEERRRARACAVKEKPYWMTQGGSWPQRAEDVDLMRACAAARLSLPVEMILQMEESLKSANFSPWSLRPLERGENDYKLTLDVDGQPVEGEVGERSTKHAENIAIRFAGEDASRSREPNGSGVVRVDTRGIGISLGQEGPGSLSGVPRPSLGEASTRDRRPTGQTQGGRLPPWRGGGGAQGCGRGGRGGTAQRIHEPVERQAGGDIAGGSRGNGRGGFGERGRGRGSKGALRGGGSGGGCSYDTAA